MGFRIMKAAIINNTNNIVDNVIVWSQGDIVPDGFTAVELDDNFEVGPGWTWIDGTNFINPNSIPANFDVPQVVSSRQARLVLLNQGLLANVEAMIAQQDTATRITWEYATEFRRDDPLLTSLAANLGLSDEEIDDFFVQASGL